MLSLNYLTKYSITHFRCRESRGTDNSNFFSVPFQSSRDEPDKSVQTLTTINNKKKESNKFSSCLLSQSLLKKK